MSAAQAAAAEDDLHSSWEDLDFLRVNGSSTLEHVPSSSSIHDEDVEQMLLDAQLESERKSSMAGSGTDSPALSMSAHSSPKQVALEPGDSGNRTNHLRLEEVAQAKILEAKSLSRESAEWIWEWASRPEHIPPKEFSFKHLPQPQKPSEKTAQPEIQTPVILSLQQTGLLKKGDNNIFSTEMLLFFIPSLLVSHLLTLGLGIYIGKRLATSSSTL